MDNEDIPPEEDERSDIDTVQEDSDIVQPLEVKVINKDTPKEPTPYDSTDSQEYDDLRDEDIKNIKKDLKIDG